MPHRAPVLLRLLAAVTLNLAVAYQAEAGPRPVVPRGPLTAEEKATISLFENSKASVVYISTSERVLNFWTRNVMTVPRGTGSGFFWDEKGHIVTNLHVVNGAASANVRLADGRDYPARLVGASEAHDIAVLKVDIPSNSPAPIPVGTSRDLLVGQKVFAIGNPFGLDWTLTTGIVSALDRSLTGEDGVLIQHLVQTDAAINPGNSGGVLLDSAGRLIGMNTAIYSPSGASAGVGFAVPVDTVNRIVPQLIQYGKVERPGLGVNIANEQIASRLDIDGVLIIDVAPGGAAEHAGLVGTQPGPNGRWVLGDVIVALDGATVHQQGDLYRFLDDHKVGDKVKLTVMRDGQKRDVELTLQSLDQ